MKYPLAAPLAALATGILAAQYAAFTFAETALSCLLLAVLAWAGLRFEARRAGLAAALAAFVLAGATAASRPEEPPPSRIDLLLERRSVPLEDPIRLRGWVRAPPEAFPDADRFVLEAESIFRGTSAAGGVQVTVGRLPGAAPLELGYGRRVEFLARLRVLRNYQNEGAFDRVGYLHSREIYMRANVRPGVPVFDLGPSGANPLVAWVWEARLAARKRLTALLGASESAPAAAVSSDPEGDSGGVQGLLGAVLLGNRSGLDPETSERFRETGAYHALVISGLHVGMLAFALAGLFRLLALPRALAMALTLGAVAAYALLVGATLPVTRAAWMLAAYLAASLLYRQRRAINVIAGTAFVFLTVKPELLFDPGFQMSFAAVGLIAAIGVPVLERTLEPWRLALVDLWQQDRDLHLPPESAQYRVALRAFLEPLAVLTRTPLWVASGAVCTALRLLIWTGEIVLLSLIIQAGLALPLAAHFQRISWGGVTANILLLPLMSLLVPAGLLALALNSVWLAALAERVAAAITTLVAWHAETLPVDLRVPPPPAWLGLAFAASLILLAAALDRRRRRLPAAALSAVLLAVLAWHPFPLEHRRGWLEMTALDVGQGESLFLAFPGGRTMVIDGGGFPVFGSERPPPIDIGEAVVSPYLWSRSVQRIDVLAVTHPDFDHLGGVPALLENFEVGELWLAEDARVSAYRPLIAQARGEGVRVVRLARGDRRRIGEVTIGVLSPPVRGVNGFSRNDRSMVLRASYGLRSLLLTADIEQAGEKALLAKGLAAPAQVLKVAHHGSDSSTGRAFLHRVRPLFAVVSAGYDNFYGHPDPSVLARLRNAGVRILRTDRDGRVTIATDGRRWRISTYRQRRREEQEGRRMASRAGSERLE